MSPARTEKSHGADERHQQQRALGQDAMEILQIDRHQLDLGETLRQAVEAALERPDRPTAPRAFRKQDQRVAGVEQSRKRLQRVARSPRRAVDQHGVEAIEGEISPEPRGTPVVERGNRMGLAPEHRRERRHDDRRVQMARMVGEVDAPAWDGCGALPMGLGPRQQAQQAEKDRLRQRRHPRPRRCAMARLRVQQVTALPAAMRRPAASRL